MLFKPLLGTDLSGKVGGIVASHNAGGAYFKAATIPTNPNTIFQQVVRSAISALTVTWEGGLTQQQRDAWDVYAANVKVTNRIGEQVNISGLAMFVRSNVVKYQTLIALQNDAPTVFNIGGRTANLASNATEAGQTVDVGYGASTTGDPWANEVGSYLVVYIGRPQNAGIKFFKGPYRLAGILQGDPVPPVAPFTVATPFAFVAGQRIFTRAIVTYADGRYTSDFKDSTLAVA